MQADTLEELAEKMGVPAVNLVKTVEEYNAAAKAGTAAELEVPRVTQEAVALENGPFYALPIRNAVFVCFGGVAVDKQARVLDHSRQVIPGLYATGAAVARDMQVGGSCNFANTSAFIAVNDALK